MERALALEPESEFCSAVLSICHQPCPALSPIMSATGIGVWWGFLGDCWQSLLRLTLWRQAWLCIKALVSEGWIPKGHLAISVTQPLSGLGFREGGLWIETERTIFMKIFVRYWWCNVLTPLYFSKRFI